MTGSRSLLTRMTTLAALALAAAGATAAEPAAEYARLRDRAEDLYAEHSYARAHEVYLEALALAGELEPAQARWIEFRVADTMWRAKAGTTTHDDTVFENARRALDELTRAAERPDDRDLVWAEAQESLGDFWWAREQSRNWGQGWNYYRQALDWWAGNRDLEIARRRYLDIVWKMAEPPWRDRYGWYGYYNIDLNVLENALRIARRADDKARAHFLLAVGLSRYGGSWQQRRRIETEFEAALEFGRRNPWYDDALFQFAQWLANNGRVIVTGPGQWRQEPDYARAVELYRRLLNEFDKGDTRYWDQAKNQIEQITGPQLSAGVSNIFLPGSEVSFDLNWRNLEGVDLSLHRVDLTRDVDPVRGARRSPGEWIWHIDPTAGTRVKAWSHDTKDDGKHRWGSASIRIEEHLPAGAYLLVATGGGRTARELILITDVSIILKSWRGKALAYACDAIDGSPIAGARVRVWTYRYQRDRWSGDDVTAETGDDGLCRFDVDTSTRSRESYYGFLVTASVDGRQAFAVGGGFQSPGAPDKWRIHATTDRPAYRPDETVRWKFTARTNDGSGYATPAGSTIHYEITGPRGKADDGTVTLNEFGSAWGELELAESMALGEYQVAFRTGDGRNWIGSATLFRIEEYKLPEFEVAVTTPRDEDGRPKTFKVGDTVEAQIEASYYFGGPVARANVEVLVYQKPFYHWWMPPRDYPWYYGQENQWQYWGGQGQIIKRETLETDDLGHATVAFETPAGGGQDFEYRIEARVTDSSRREISAADTVRVTRQRYYVHPRPRHNLHRPGDKVEIDFKTIDANQRPVSVKGTVTVTRDRWVEIWLDPAGREVTGSALADARRRSKTFPPPAEPGDDGWRLKFHGYSSQEVLERTVKTDDEGEAVIAFVARAEGYYRVAWSSEDTDGAPIAAQTTVWVADRATTELGYRAGGVEIIADKDTFRTGETAAVMLSVPTNDRWVLFSVEGDDLHSYRLVHVTGTVKLIQFPIEQRHVPNVRLSALMVTDGQLFADTEEVIVPPVDSFLDVEILTDRDAYEPRDEGTLTVVTRDADGNPVSAEVALGLVDESVYFIQQPYAPDPRQFFYGVRQGQVVQTASTFNIKSYVKLVKAGENELIDARFADQLKEEGRLDDVSGALESAEYAARSRGAAPGRGGGDEMRFADAKASSDMAANAPASEPIGQIVGGVPGPPPQDPNAEPAVTVRSDFRSTVLWKPDVVTGRDGTATVSVTFPDNLTRWKATATAATAGSRVGTGDAATRTRLPLIARLQAPRFFVTGDTVTLSGVFNNNTDEAMMIRPDLEADGLKIVAIVEAGRRHEPKAGQVRIPAHGEARVDWIAVAEQPGEASLLLVARGEEHTDAMSKTYPVHEHGVERFIASSGKVRGEAVTVTLDIPAQRKAGSTTMTVSVSSSMAVTMLDALPYLVDYPYGCTEQTMSRFLPAVVTAATLEDLGLSADDALGRVFGGIEQQFVDETHPGGDRKRRNLRKLDVIVNRGLDRLYDFQHADGGWGWWKGGESDHYMTAYVLWGLCLAREAGLDVRGHVMDRAAAYLDVEIVEEERHQDMQAWMLHALASYDALSKQPPGKRRRAAFGNLWESRDRLNAYTRALLALAAHAYGDRDRALVLVRNLENGVVRDDAPDASILLGSGRRAHPAVIGTAHWGADTVWRSWSQGGVEATAFALEALVRIDPGNALIEPATNWIVKNRRGAQWSNTRDTAITVLALNDYLRASGELEPQLEYDLIVNGKRIARTKITADEALSGPSRFEIDAETIRDGANVIEIVRRNGEGPIYFSAEAGFFSLEEPVPASGNEIFVRRDYYKLVPRETLLKGFVYEREPVTDGDYVTSGERVQVVVTVEAKNDYEYLVFEDLKPAGLEAVEVRSGQPMYARELKSGAVEHRFGDGDGRSGSEDYTGRQRWIHQELRDRKVAAFIDRLPEGTWEIVYDLRAEIPGEFHALPVLGHAMYVPEIRCNSAEIRLTVNDRPAADVVAVGD